MPGQQTDRRTIERCLKAFNDKVEGGGVTDNAQAQALIDVINAVMSTDLFREYAERRTDVHLHAAWKRMGQIRDIDQLKELLYTTWGEGVVLGHAIAHYQITGALPSWS